MRSYFTLFQLHTLPWDSQEKHCESFIGELLSCGVCVCVCVCVCVLAQGGGGGGDELEAGVRAVLRPPASSESQDPANVNTSKEVFSIKVSNIWLHKHDTGCKNKAKDLLLITSIKAV